MLAKLDALIEKDGALANAAGAVATACYSILLAGMVPPEHFEGVAVLAAICTVFAPAAKRRELNAKRAKLEAKEGGGDDA